jgi:hypothetical protein
MKVQRAAEGVTDRELDLLGNVDVSCNAPSIWEVPGADGLAIEPDFTVRIEATYSVVDPVTQSPDKAL